MFFHGIGLDHLLDDGPHAAVTAGECDGHSQEAPCPSGGAHDHCGVFCGHFFNAIPAWSGTVFLKTPDVLSLLPVRQESAPDGFPPGLFIPPRAS